jgi:hypothetical protein
MVAWSSFLHPKMRRKQAFAGRASCPSGITERNRPMTNHDVQEMTFTLTIDSQDILVRYRPHYFVAADYAQFEFTSPHESRRRIPVSETGYRSHFSPMHEVEAAPSVKEYALALVRALMVSPTCPEEKVEGDDRQFALF